jgi:periplasmic protein TonB
MPRRLDQGRFPGMNDGPTEASTETPPFMARARLPEGQASEISAGGMEEGSLAASFNLHAVVILTFLSVALVPGCWPTPEPEATLKVTLISLGPGSAGASGGVGGGGGEAAEANTTPPAANAEAPPSETNVAEAQDTPRQTEPEPPQVAEAPSTLPAEPPPPPPRRKPPAMRSSPSTATRTLPPSAAPPTLEMAQIAAAPLDMPLPGAPGQGSGPGGQAGLGTGATGAGRGAIGDGLIEGPGDDYLDRLRRWLNKYKHFPEEAQKQKQHGQLVVSFTILRDGTVRDPRVERSSGFPLLDDAAVQMLRDASPVPPLPEKFRASQVAVDLPVEFTIGFLERIF